MSMPDSSIYLSTGAFKAASLAEMLCVCDELNFYNIELSSGVPWSARLESDLTAARSKCRFLVHNYFPPPKVPFVLNLAAKDPEILRRSREHCRKAVALCAEVEAPFYSVHSGFAFDAVPARLGGDLTGSSRYPLTEAKDIFVESLRLLCEDCARHHITLAIENNVVSRTNLIGGENLLLLGATADDLLELCETVGSDILGVLVDVGHAHVTAATLGFDESDFLRQLDKFILAFHLNDNDGVTDSNALFNEQSWFISALRGSKKRTMIIESYSLSVLQIKQAISLVRSL